MPAVARLPNELTPRTFVYERPRAAVTIPTGLATAG